MMGLRMRRSAFTTSPFFKSIIPYGMADGRSGFLLDSM
jgi:hypothetical protein